MNIFTVLKNLNLLFAVAFILASCGGGGNGSVDSSAPTAIITFPPAVTATEGDRIIVRGTTTDESEITVVRVNGVDATSSDNFATWQALVNLIPGPNTLSVETGDIALNSDMVAASVQINAYGRSFDFPIDVVLDSANNRALVVDTYLKALITVDLTTGVRSILSDATIPNAVNAFSNPKDIALDSANNRLLVVDSALQALIAVDLNSGVRTILSETIGSTVGFVE